MIYYQTILDIKLINKIFEADKSSLFRIVFFIYNDLSLNSNLTHPPRSALAYRRTRTVSTRRVYYDTRNIIIRV